MVRPYKANMAENKRSPARGTSICSTLVTLVPSIPDSSLAGSKENLIGLLTTAWILDRIRSTQVDRIPHTSSNRLAMAVHFMYEHCLVISSQCSHMPVSVEK